MKFKIEYLIDGGEVIETEHVDLPVESAAHDWAEQEAEELWTNPARHNPAQYKLYRADHRGEYFFIGSWTCKQWYETKDHKHTIREQGNDVLNSIKIQEPDDV
jgi:hypothetical protein